MDTYDASLYGYFPLLLSVVYTSVQVAGTLVASVGVASMNKSRIRKDAETSCFLLAKVECGQLLQPIRKSRSSCSEQVASLNDLATGP